MIPSSLAPCSILNSPLPSPSPTLGQRLQCLLQIRPGKWDYAIFWQKSVHDNDRLTLVWGEGHFNNDSKRPDPKKPLEWLSCDNFEERYGSIEDVTDFECCSTGNTVWLTGEQELLQFSSSEGVQEAHMQGIQTFVCIPTQSGVVELGSSELIGKNLELMQQAKSLFGSDIGVTTGLSSSVRSEHSNSNDRPLMVAMTNNKRKPKRERKPVIGSDMGTHHVIAERQRRKKLNHGFYALRDVVPYTNILKVDEASLLADAVWYIKELKEKVVNLESQVLHRDSKKTINAGSGGAITDDKEDKSAEGLGKMEIEVKVMGSDGMIRFQCENRNHPSAKVMDTLRHLDFKIHHGSVSSMKEMMLYDFVVKLPEGLRGEEIVKAALLDRLE